MAFPKQLADLLDRLQADTISQNVIGSFDSFLTAITGSGPIIAPLVYGTNPMADTMGTMATMMKQMQEREKVLGEIDRQLFLQFLEGEITYLKTHRQVKSLALYHRVSHDQQVCQKRQSQIRAALYQLFSVQQIDKGFYSALTAERGKTFLTFIKMKLSEDFAFTPTIDDYLEARETSAVRKIVEQVLVSYANDDGNVFDAHAAWIDLKQRWDGWASKHRERLIALKKYWTAAGGGKSVDSAPEAIPVIKDYYKALYETIEEGDLARMIRQAAAFGN